MFFDHFSKEFAFVFVSESVYGSGEATSSNVEPKNQRLGTRMN